MRYFYKKKKDSDFSLLIRKERKRIEIAINFWKKLNSNFSLLKYVIKIVQWISEDFIIRCMDLYKRAMIDWYLSALLLYNQENDRT